MLHFYNPRKYRFSDVFRGYMNVKLAWNGLRALLHNQQYFMSLKEPLHTQELMTDVTNVLEYK